jgi:CHAT domain-containing protein
LLVRAELVTLSACETGTGKINGQEGVSSLVRPFLLAGARTVVASLWAADDEFSRGLMTEFYRQLASGAEKGVALRQAKLEMIRRFGSYATPYLWSGFVLVGDNMGRLPGPL